MANQLKMALVESIITLHGHGWSARRIARELGIHRETVGRYVNCASPPAPASNAPTGSEPDPQAGSPNAPIGVDTSKPGSNAPIRCGMIVLYRSIFDLARDFMNEETLGDESNKTLARYLKPDLLVIDDMGMKQLPRRSGEYRLEIIMRRHENRSTLMTSNRPLEDWAKLIGDVPSINAITTCTQSPRLSRE